MYRLSIIPLAAAAIISAQAEVLDITRVKYSGPFEVLEPVRLGMPAPSKTTILQDVAISSSAPSTIITLDSIAPGADFSNAVHVLSFDIDARRYTPAKLIIDGIDTTEVSVNGKKITDLNLKLSPASYHFDIKYASKPGHPQKLAIKLEAEKEGAVSIASDGSRMMSLPDVMYGTRIISAALSPSGRYLVETTLETDDKGVSQRSQRLYDLKSKGGKQSRFIGENVRWMPKSDLLYAVREDYEHRRHLVTIDPATGLETIAFDHLPKGSFEVSPTEDALIYSIMREGMKEDPDAYQVLEPDDRQPGWRDRYYPALYRNGSLVPVTSGAETSVIADITDDGRKALVMTYRSAFGQTQAGQPVLRPTSLTTITSIDLDSFKADTIVCDDGFISDACFSPDGALILVKGTPEAFSRIGCILPDSVTPSMTQQELFIVDAKSKKVTPMSRSFSPNPLECAWSKHDGKIYFRAEKRDMYALYSLDPSTGTYTELPVPENIVKGFSLSRADGAIAVWAQSDSNPDRLYCLDGKRKEAVMLDDPSASRLANVRRAKCIDYDFTNSVGDTIYGRYYLPDDFDPEKRYPLIVNYYGGCSPTQRAFETRYPWHIYAQRGYVVYVLNPSGATGFGQEFSSRHVSTAGEGVARDIIEGTQKFIADHKFIDPAKVGCIGASYGGFMTMYLQTVTDMFAAAISHAGISDHTSYWGEGYWGYSYSQVSMGADLPWTATDLYVKQSPLYRADKIKTPLLLLHGDGDTNVPPGESIQMFTALKLLGVPTALVEISGQNHHITDFEKRGKWQDTIFAWFARYLQDDPDWWDALYPAKGY